MWPTLKTSEKSIIFKNRRNRKELQRYIKSREEQEDIDNAAKALEIDG